MGPSFSSCKEKQNDPGNKRRVSNGSPAQDETHGDPTKDKDQD